MTQIAYLSLGSNLADRPHSLHDAITRLKDHGTVRAVSHLYETEPVEFTDQPWFLNCAVEIETSEPPEQLMRNLLAIEQAMGRVRTQPKGPRIIDIDILLFADVILETPNLTIPHPAMHQRRFVLEPLAEIAPETQHPIFKKTIRELQAELPPGQTVIRKT
jgi:2-amino-4-hydroxy-6-hydroxymethyldihydropteridine diphosphokinase